MKKIIIILSAFLAIPMSLSTPLYAMQNKPGVQQNQIIQKIDQFLAVSNILTPQTTGVQILKTQIAALQASSRTDKTAYIEKVYNTLPLLKNTVTNSSYAAEQMPPRVNLQTAENKLIRPRTLGDLAPYIDAMERVLNKYFENQGIKPTAQPAPIVPPRTTSIQTPPPVPPRQPKEIVFQIGAEPKTNEDILNLFIEGLKFYTQLSNQVKGVSPAAHAFRDRIDKLNKHLAGEGDKLTRLKGASKMLDGVTDIANKIPASDFEAYTFISRAGATEKMRKLVTTPAAFAESVEEDTRWLKKLILEATAKEIIFAIPEESFTPKEILGYLIDTLNVDTEELVNQVKGNSPAAHAFRSKIIELKSIHKQLAIQLTKGINKEAFTALLDKTHKILNEASYLAQSIATDDIEPCWLITVKGMKEKEDNRELLSLPKHLAALLAGQVVFVANVTKKVSQLPAPPAPAPVVPPATKATPKLAPPVPPRQLPAPPVAKPAPQPAAPTPVVPPVAKATSKLAPTPPIKTAATIETKIVSPQPPAPTSQPAEPMDQQLKKMMQEVRKKQLLSTTPQPGPTPSATLLAPVAPTSSPQQPPAQTQASIIPPSLSNIGNTCFMNAALQALYALTDVTNTLLQQPDTWYKPESLPAEYVKFIKKMGQTPAGTPVAPGTVCTKGQDEIFRISRGKVKPGQQSDAAEFLSILLEQLITPDPTKTNKAIENLVALNLATQLTKGNPEGTRSVKISEKTEPSLILKVDAYQNMKNLQDCFIEFFKPEFIADYKFTLPGQREEKGAFRQYSLDQLKKYFIVEVNAVNQITRQKLQLPISFPLTLNMSGYAQSNLPDYELIGCIMHSGSKESGHYTAYIKKSGEWYYCNDAVITKLTDQAITMQAIAQQGKGHAGEFFPQVLLYQRK